MENILAIYAMPPDDDIPLVCMDEQPVQLLEDRISPISAKPASVAKEDYQYERNGTCNIFMFVAPHLGIRHVDVTDRRTKVDYAHQLDYLVNELFPNAPKIRLVQDNLNTHTFGSLYETFEPTKARSIAERLEFHYTPKHGSWLNIAEIELSALTTQCLDRRISDKDTLKHEVLTWATNRNEMNKIVSWHFTNEDARGKLRSLYPVTGI
jgi:hypothetical protein